MHTPVIENDRNSHSSTISDSNLFDMYMPVVENDIDSDIITVGDSQLTSGRRQPPSKFKCLYTNAQSIVKKHLELEALVNIYDPDIIGITETWLNNKVSDKEYCIEVYQKPIRQDRLDTKDGRGGGVMLFIKNDIDFVQIFHENSEHFSNSVWIKIAHNQGKKTVIGVIYRSPNSTRENNDRLINCIKEIAHRELILMGDFNYPDIDWENISAGHEGSLFFNTVMDYFLYQHVRFPTREENILDLVLTSDLNMVNSIECVGKLGTSDHVLIC